jgi:hypothetical protein
LRTSPISIFRAAITEGEPPDAVDTGTLVADVAFVDGVGEKVAGGLGARGVGEVADVFLTREGAEADVMVAGGGAVRPVTLPASRGLLDIVSTLEFCVGDVAVFAGSLLGMVDDPPTSD